MSKPQTLDNKKRVSLLSGFRSWKLEDAKSRFSELVKSAKSKPQRVTVHGNDAVMVVDADTFAKLLPASAQPSLHELLSSSPLSQLEFNHQSVRSPVRDVEL